MTLSETFLQGAQQARNIAAEYRRDAQSNEISPRQRESWLENAKRAEERAEDLETRAGWYRQ